MFLLVDMQYFFTLSDDISFYFFALFVSFLLPEIKQQAKGMRETMLVRHLVETKHVHSVQLMDGHGTGP